MPSKPEDHRKERVAGASPDLQAELRAQLRALAPEAFAEGKLDAGKLRALLGENGDAGPERYSFSWAGKRDAIAMLQVPTRATLVPDREHSVNFDEAQHVFIEGENLEVLKVLYRSYFGRVKMIYIDPPYNTGNDFIYPDDFADPLDNYLRITGQKNGNGDYTTSQVDKNGRIHSAWLSMMYPRLVLCRQFLCESGVVFISIDDKELSNLTRLLDEVFGEENRVGIICWRNVTDNNPTLINKDNEFVLCYAKDKPSLPEAWKSRQSDEKEMLLKFHRDKESEGLDPKDIEVALRDFLTDNGEVLEFVGRYNRVDEHGIYTGSESVHNPRAGGYSFEVIHPVTMKEMRRPANGYRFPELTFREMEKSGRIIYGKDEKRIVKIKKYLDEYEDTLRSIITMDGRLGSYDLKRVFGTEEVLFDNPKPVALMQRLVSFATGKDDIILDLFAGAGTTAQAVIELNRRDDGARQAILVQLPELTPDKSPAKLARFRTISSLGKARVQKVIDALADGKNVHLRGFALAGSNLRTWIGVADKDAPTLATQIEAFADSLLPGWKSEDVIWETALREGYSLTSRIEKIPDTGKQMFWRVTDPDREQSFVICLDDTLTLDAVRALKLPNDALFICRDTALDDTLSVNLALQCRLKVL